METYVILSDEQYRELKRIRDYCGEAANTFEEEKNDPRFFDMGGRWAFAMGQLSGTIISTRVNLNSILDTAAIVYGEDPTYEMSECANGPHFWNQNELHLIDDSHCPDCQEVAPARVNPDPEDVEAET